MEGCWEILPESWVFCRRGRSSVQITIKWERETLHRNVYTLYYTYTIIFQKVNITKFELQVCIVILSRPPKSQTVDLPRCDIWKPLSLLVFTGNCRINSAFLVTTPKSVNPPVLPCTNARSFYTALTKHASEQSNHLVNLSTVNFAFRQLLWCCALAQDYWQLTCLCLEEFIRAGLGRKRARVQNKKRYSMFVVNLMLHMLSVGLQNINLRADWRGRAGEEEIICGSRPWDREWD